MWQFTSKIQVRQNLTFYTNFSVREAYIHTHPTSAHEAYTHTQEYCNERVTHMHIRMYMIAVTA